MTRQEGHKHTYIPFHVARGEIQNEGCHGERREPQYNRSNESSSSIAELRVARDISAQNQAGYQNDDDIERGFLVVNDPDTSTSRPPSATGSEHTVVNRDVAATLEPPIVPAFPLTEDNIGIHDRVEPLGIMATYQWIHGQPCPGYCDVKDISSEASIKVRPGRSRASQTTDSFEDGYGLVNHPAEALVACAGDWADVAARPDSLDKTLLILDDGLN